MYIAGEVKESEIRSGVMGLLLLGIVYHYRFRFRYDWVSTLHFFHQAALRRDFLANSELSESKLRVHLVNQPWVPAHVDAYRYSAAIGSTRLARRITDDGVEFELPGGGFDPSEFYLYDHNIDFGPYRSLPPYVGQLLNPLSNYFVLKIGEFRILSSSELVILSPKILSAAGFASLRYLKFRFGLGFRPRSVEIGLCARVSVGLLFDEEMLLVLTDNVERAVFNFLELESSLSTVPKMLREEH